MVKVKLTTEDGITVELDAAPDEYHAALATTLSALRGTAAPDVAEGTGKQPGPDDLRRLANKLSREAAGFLRLLVDHPDGLTDDELMETLDIEPAKRQQLGALAGAVTRVAKGLDLDPEALLDRDVSRRSDGSRSYRYWVPVGVLDELDTLLPPAPRRQRPDPTPPPADDDVPF